MARRTTDQPEASGVEPTPEERAQALREFLGQGWGDQPVRVRPHPAVKNFAARRRAVSRGFAGLNLVVPAGPPKVRSNDDDYRYRPGSDFYYLTGAMEADDVLVMTPTARGHRAVLYMRERGAAGTRDFFDYKTGEMWVPPRPGLAETRDRLGIETAPLEELPAVLKALDPAATLTVRGIDPAIDRRLRRNPEDQRFATALSELRLIKDAWEVGELRRAIKATATGFNEVVDELAKAVATSERWVEGVFNRRARVDGNDVGYGSIAAAGEHATTLHWTRNDGPVKPGSLLLLDAGVEGNGLYTADVTRTLPVSGTFTPAQREIYELVLKAQEAGIAACRPGAEFADPGRAASAVLAAGLRRLGIPSTALPAALSPEAVVRRYQPHGVSHMLGLDVHDCAQARDTAYRGVLKPGYVLTVEPGLYFKPNDMTVPKRYRGIGVRIEDDVLITDRGHRVLSSGIPKQTDAVERWVQSALRRSAKRTKAERALGA